MNRERLLERFLRYVAVNTMADDQSNSYPSSKGQYELGSILRDELDDLKLEDVEQDANGLVWATIPSNVGSDVPVVALNSHIDTSPETTGEGVKPQVIRDYDGQDIQLPGDPSKIIRGADNPELADLKGCTLITTDGTTLLGGDDKAGIAIIIELAAFLQENPDIKHGPIRVLFTCDEEIGHGVDHVDLDKLGATVCYTLDGPGAGHLDVETFSADLATIRFTGVNIHPSIAKHRMVNAVRVAAAFVDKMPVKELSPESTSGREGFMHPYQQTGGVEETILKVILRDFDTANLKQQADRLQKTADEVTKLFPGSKIDIDVQAQYRNLGDGLLKEPRAVDFVEKATARLNRPIERSIIRGGTDGSRLTELGLPTPNLSSGQHNPHSPLEWACLDEMQQAVELLVEIVQVWAE